MLQIRQKFFSHNLYGACLILCGGVTTAGANALTHSLSTKYAAMQVLFLKSLIGLLVLCGVCRRQLRAIISTNILAYHALKGVFGAIGNWFWITALLYLPLAACSALSLTSALMTSIGGWIIFKERFYWPVLIAGLFGFMGVYIILEPGWALFSYYAFFPLLSAASFSGSSLLIKKLAISDSSTTTLFYLMLFMTLFSSIPAFYAWVPFTNTDTLKTISVGAFYALTQLCIIEAYTYAAASYIAPFKFVRFPLNVASGFLFFLEVPTIVTLVGAAIIALAYGYLYYFEKKTMNET